MAVREANNPSNVRNVEEAWSNSGAHVDPRTLVTPLGLSRKSQAWTRSGWPACLLPAVVHNAQLIPAISIVRAMCSRRPGAIRLQRTSSRPRAHQVEKSSVDRCMHDTCSVGSSSRDRFPTARAPARAYARIPPAKSRALRDSGTRGQDIRHLTWPFLRRIKARQGRSFGDSIECSSLPGIAKPRAHDSRPSLIALPIEIVNSLPAPRKRGKPGIANHPQNAISNGGRTRRQRKQSRQP